jgi:hypothetical protein
MWVKSMCVPSSGLRPLICEPDDEGECTSLLARYHLCWVNHPFFSFHQGDGAWGTGGLTTSWTIAWSQFGYVCTLMIMAQALHRIDKCRCAGLPVPSYMVCTNDRYLVYSENLHLSLSGLIWSKLTKHTIHSFARHTGRDTKYDSHNHHSITTITPSSISQFRYGA